VPVVFTLSAFLQKDMENQSDRYFASDRFRVFSGYPEKPPPAAVFLGIPLSLKSTQRRGFSPLGLPPKRGGHPVPLRALLARLGGTPVGSASCSSTAAEILQRSLEELMQP
jgi:hypothetical protein